MEKKDLKYKVIEANRLAELLEMQLLVDKLGFGSSASKYKRTKEGIKLLGYVQDELDKHHNLSDVIEEILDAENISDVSDEEKEDMLYVEEFDSCDCECYSDYDDEDDEEEVEAIYVVLHLDEDYADADEDSWADEFDDFYSDSFENSIFKEMEDFVNGKYPTSMEQEQEQKNMPDNVIIGPELYQILEDYFKKMFE